ncbi:MAG: stage II sporulation protein M [Verrucomicrobia bacterium]|nr:stage II sporulation protein M [Verrucomicrobiota bacterium]MBI3870306.1 stage II sporulation protein M [Verrucomicrobiota bacterium]
MIIDIPRFMESERPYWAELEALLKRLEREKAELLSFTDAQRFHYLYERASADLARIVTFSSEPELRDYLEALVARAYGEIHESRRSQRSVAIWWWLSVALPRAFRRRRGAFYLTVAVTVFGAVFGGLAVALDDEAKEAVLPAMFANHMGDPRKRVAQEEGRGGAARKGGGVTASATRMTAFSAMLMQNNIGVAVKSLALGMTYGVGTLVLLFYNGVILGVVATDYALAGETVFLLGWILPHGVIEIPAILISAQAGLVLAHALIGWGRRERLRERLRSIAPDLATLIAAAALLLVWAGIVEAFFSQFHEPALPYAVKIAFGTAEFILLVAYLGLCGRSESSRLVKESA